MDDDGIRKSAILLLSLGEDEAAGVLKLLGPREVQRIGEAMAALKTVTREQISATLGEFCENASAQSGIGLAGDDYIRSVLRKALGDDRAANLIERILKDSDNHGIDGLKWMDATSVAELVQGEHPQIIATILVHLDREHAARVLQEFNERLRSDVMLRVATLDSIQPAAMRELNDVLSRLLAGGGTVRKEPMGGPRAAAEILNFLPNTQEAPVVESVREFDAGLAQDIVDQMFVWENVLALEDRAVQTLLREVQSESLILALKGSSQELRDKIFRNMSQRAAEMLKEDLEAKGAVRISEVETQQKEILKVIRRLADEGQIMLGNGGEAFV